MKERTSFLFWIVASAAITVLLSCSSSDAPGQQIPCDGPDDCTSGERCTDGFCVIDSSPETTGGEPTTSRRSEPSTSSSSSSTGGEPTSTADDYQQPCERDSDCESGICLRTPEGSFCSRPCAFDDECDGELDWICARVAEGGRDTVQICFPEADFLCAACVADTDCGGRQDQCVGLNNGSFCGSSCAGDGICPEGYDCVGFEDEEQCVPTNNYCGECFNLDFSANVDHCGGCGQSCSLPGAVNACADGQCTLAGCQEHRANCDGLVASGCEVDLRSDPAHCGACDFECSLSAADALCVAGACVIDRCDANRASCDGDDATGCEVNTATDLAHCGDCDSPCALDNALPECLGGECRIASCESGFANCNDQTADGCETNLQEDDENCGACNQLCTGGRSCESGACRCPAGEVFFEEECQEGVLPVVRTDEPGSLTTSSVTLRGFVEEPGVPRLTAHGLCWFEGVERPEGGDDDPTDPDPTDPDPTDPGPGEGSEFEDGEITCVNFGPVEDPQAISHALTGLEPGSEWTVFAWGEVLGGEYVEGEEISFRVLQEPAVRTEVPTGLTTSSAVLGGEVTVVGVPEATRHGVCWGRDNPQPSLTNGTCEDLGAIAEPGSFTHTATGLTAGGLYTVRAFVVNDVATRYGDALNFRIRQEPVVVTDAPVEVARESVRVQGSVTRVGVPDIADHGLCFGASPAAALPDAPVPRCETFGARSETGSFAATFDGLTPATAWFYTAFVEHETGLFLGETREVQTWQEPRVVTELPTQVQSNSARLQGLLQSLGVPPSGSWGFCWADNEDFDGETCEPVTTPAPAVGAFSRVTTGLTPGTEYWYRAWVENEVERVFGDPETFRTQQEPAIDTLAPADVGATTATLGGDVLVLGVPAADDHGVCWGQVPTPSLTNATCARLGDEIELGTFTVPVEELLPGRDYTARAFISSELGTRYGEPLSFSTLEAPSVDTEGILATTTTTLRLQGRILGVGRPDISAHGICLADNAADAQPADPAQTCENLGARSTTGTFAIDFEGLTSGATYHYSAWAQNSAGLDFGETRTARTWAPPAVVTLAVQNVTQTGARLRGEANDLGFPAATAWGFCYDTDEDFASEECVALSSTPALSTFQRDVAGLISGATYYVRAWVENSTGRVFGQTLSFRTLQLPVVVTDPAQDVERESATLFGTLTSLGNPDATEHGFCWGTMPEPSLDNDATCEMLGAPAGTGSFSDDLTGLSQGTTYTFRAFAINALQAVYGSARTFRTQRDAQVVTLVPDDRGSDTLRFRARIDQEPIPDRTAQGFCWSSSSTIPDESDSCIAVPDVDSNGIFTFVATGLTPDATYRVRAWVDNSARRTWGSVAQEQTCSLDDQPDGVDRNCDGVDGNVSRSIFVNRAIGSDTGGCGLVPAAPCATIQFGINRAASLPERSDVLVTIADYDETVTLANGVNLYGGYLPATWMRDSSSRTGIRPAGSVALIVDGYASAGIVEGFTIRSSDGNVSSPTSRALVLRDVSGALRFRNNEIRAGLGFPGAPGASGSTGANGQTGEPGSNGQFEADAPGGPGGTSTCGAAGGAGGLGRDNASGLAGGSGAGPLGGAGGDGRSRACFACLESAGSGRTGDDGDNGGNGANAGAVANQARGDLLDLDWRGRAGNTGTAGIAGGGGGGGGAGGGLCSDDTLIACGSHSGGGGGGGGGGGCGGGGGAGGGGGGGSIAVLAINAAAAIFEGNIIRTDGAGNGGAGGVGAEGGEGAGGQNGGFESQRTINNVSSGSGGTGGAGGDGGTGGNGGGGAGGTSAGFLLHNSAGLQQTGSTFNVGSAGSGGAGGSSSLGTAPAGANGRSGNVLTW